MLHAELVEKESWDFRTGNWFMRFIGDFGLVAKQEVWVSNPKSDFSCAEKSGFSQFGSAARVFDAFVSSVVETVRELPN